MEDDQETPQTTPPDSLLPYDRWTEEALRHVVMKALNHAAMEGMPGQHHYYITFRTDFPGVVIPPRLRAKYPQEMTIVLQHQFDDLVVDEAGRSFGVALSFGGVRSALSIPLDAVSAFVDPHVQFGLRFRVDQPVAAEAPAVTAAPALALEAPAGETRSGEASGGETPQVVSLDAFRRRKD